VGALPGLPARDSLRAAGKIFILKKATAKTQWQAVQLDVKLER
jgi:hypothetical protein